MKGIFCSSIFNVYWIWQRYVKLFYRAGLLNSLAPVVEPIVYFLTFQYALADRVPTPHGLPYELFLLAGMMPVGIMFVTVFEASYTTFSQLHEKRFWELLIRGPLILGDIYLGTLFWYGTRGLFSATLIYFAGQFFSEALPFSFLLKSLPLACLCGIFFGVLGSLFAILVKNVYQLNFPVFYFILPMYALSGVYFPLTFFPHWIQTLSQWLPLSIFVDAFRLQLVDEPFIWLRFALLLGFEFFLILFVYIRLQRRLIF